MSALVNNLAVAFLVGVIFNAPAAASPVLADSKNPTAKTVHGPKQSESIQLVKGFLADIRVAMGSGNAEQVRAVAERYMIKDYVQHSSAFAPGREGFIEGTVSRLPPKGAAAPRPEGDGAMRAPNDLYFFSDGDFVVWVSEGASEGKYIFNMVHIEDRKMNEHWSSF